VYLRLIIGILSLRTFAHLTVLSLSNPALNLTFSLLPITSSHPHASASESTFDYWRYINIWLTFTLCWVGRRTLLTRSVTVFQPLMVDAVVCLCNAESRRWSGYERVSRLVPRHHWSGRGRIHTWRWHWKGSSRHQEKLCTYHTTSFVYLLLSGLHSLNAVF